MNPASYVRTDFAGSTPVHAPNNVRDMGRMVHTVTDVAARYVATELP